MINYKKIILNLKIELKNNLESVVLFGSYARNDYNEKSDIDLLIITNDKLNENKLEKKIKIIEPKIQLLCLTKKEFNERVISFNHQLITLFMDGKVLYDRNKLYYKMENLFLALNRKKKFTLRIRNRVIKLNDLMKAKNFI